MLMIVMNYIVYQNKLIINKKIIVCLKYVYCFYFSCNFFLHPFNINTRNIVKFWQIHKSLCFVITLNKENEKVVEEKEKLRRRISTEINFHFSHFTVFFLSFSDEFSNFSFTLFYLVFLFNV